jgi:glycosyltransferase involved in cell wall biosynthesis
VLTVSVVIPTFKRVDMLEKSLSGVYSMEKQPDEVIVVFRPEDDVETKNWIQNIGSKRYRKLRFIEVTQPGVIEALNIGLDSVTTDIVAIFDDDAVPRKQWLGKVLKHYNNPYVVGVGGKDILYPKITKVDVTKAGYRNFWGRIIGNHHKVKGDVRKVDVLKGCNISFRVNSLGTLKFDSRLLGKGAQYGNEGWFCLNLSYNGGVLLLDPSAMVDHFPAIKDDYDRSEFKKERCYEYTHNCVAYETAFLSKYEKFKYFTFFVLIGSRYCPGFYYILHSVFKRPLSLKGQIQGGWKGLLKGHILAQILKNHPPGKPKIVK